MYRRFPAIHSKKEEATYTAKTFFLGGIAGAAIWSMAVSLI